LFEPFPDLVVIFFIQFTSSMKQLHFSCSQGTFSSVRLLAFYIINTLFHRLWMTSSSYQFHDN